MFLLKRMLGVRDLLVEQFTVQLVAFKQLFHFLVPLYQDLDSSHSVDKLARA